MRFPRVRFTVRRIMVAAVILGLVAWGIHLHGLAFYYRYRALVCRLRLESADPLADDHVDADDGTDREREFQARAGRRRLHYLSLKEKYERAALLPWLPVAPDPPEPE